MKFLLLKSSPVFNLPNFLISYRTIFCIFSKHLFSLSTHQKREKLGSIFLSPNFITFFPFPQPLFSTVSTKSTLRKVLHKTEKSFHRFSQPRKKCRRLPKTKPPQGFSEFSTFSIPPKTNTSKISLILSFFGCAFPINRKSRYVDFSTKPIFLNPRTFSINNIPFPSTEKQTYPPYQKFW